LWAISKLQPEENTNIYKFVSLDICNDFFTESDLELDLNGPIEADKLFDYVDLKLIKFEKVVKNEQGGPYLIEILFDKKKLKEKLNHYIEVFNDNNLTQDSHGFYSKEIQLQSIAEDIYKQLRKFSPNNLVIKFPYDNQIAFLLCLYFLERQGILTVKKFLEIDSLFSLHQIRVSLTDKFFEAFRKTDDLLSDLKYYPLYENQKIIAKDKINNKLIVDLTNRIITCGGLKSQLKSKSLPYKLFSLCNGHPPYKIKIKELEEKVGEYRNYIEKSVNNYKDSLKNKFSKVISKDKINRLFSIKNEYIVMSDDIDVIK